MATVDPFPPAAWAERRVSAWLERFAGGAAFAVEEQVKDERLVLTLTRAPQWDVEPEILPPPAARAKRA